MIEIKLIEKKNLILEDLHINLLLICTYNEKYVLYNNYLDQLYLEIFEIF